MIYLPVKKGFVTLQGLIDGEVSMRTYFEAINLVEFENYIQEKHCEKQEEVEYFD